MALFGPVERHSPMAWAVHGGIYFVLTLGSVTMVYPFLLMFGASFTTETDFEDWQVIPAYLTSDVALYRKWMDDRYGDNFANARRVHQLTISQFRHLTEIPDVWGLGSGGNRKQPKPQIPYPALAQRVDDWLACIRELPDDLVVAFNQDLFRTRTTHQKFAAWLEKQYEGGIAAYNRKNDTHYGGFSDVAPFEFFPTHKSRSELSPLRREYLEFRRTLPPEDLMPLVASDGFQDYLERHVGGVAEVNALLGTRYASGYDVVFPVERPMAGPLRDFWDQYVTKRYPLLFVRVEGQFDDAFRAFIASRHPNYDTRVLDYNAEHATKLPLLAETRYSPTPPLDELKFADWVDFTDQHVPPEAKRLITVEGLWREWLQRRYGTLSQMNAAHATAWRDWSEVMPPRAETDVLTFRRNQGAIRNEFLFRNYRLVLGYMLFHGRAALNTLILVLMTVAGQLTVQPLAAYGLSRFRLRYAHKILLLLLATMAFPAEVAMIPNFLLIKELGLLNTYWALVLPGLASGMGIFLLKGYFDSLPAELYEAAMMDGAGELRMFWQITIPLSKPILAVIALGAFTGAYGGFLWAFLICQNPSMWTMMVFIWQLGSVSYRSVWMASLVVAAIPTLLVFIFCQNIILRGIIVPTMK